MRLLTMLSLLSLGVYAGAADHHVINTTCPVSGKPVDKSVKMTPYNPKTDQAAKASPGGTVVAGEVVAFCCPKCGPAYSKDPAKYREDLEKQRAAAKH